MIFLEDFVSARSRAETLDRKIISSAMEVSEDLADLVSLTTRTIMGSMVITYSGGNPNDILIFVQEMEDAHYKPARSVQNILS
jgi:hypothetical protein